MDTAIKFSIANRYYSLEFLLPELPIIFLCGDSSSGKSLLVNDFIRMQQLDKNLSNSIAVNSYCSSDRLYRDIKGHTYNIVIIDNADILVTSEVDRFIKHALLSRVSTRWILIGRKIFECTLSPHCRGELIQSEAKDNKLNISVHYDDSIMGW